MFGTVNKNNTFSWADAAGKCIVLWNKPNYDSSYYIRYIFFLNINLSIEGSNMFMRVVVDS